MDGQTEPTPASNNNMKIIIPVVVAALVILGVIGVFAYQGMQNQPATPGVTPTEAMISEVPSQMPTEEVSSYKDGTYKVSGNYVSPGGPREVDVTLTLKDGVVTESAFLGKATDATSKRFQGEFAGDYESQVVGKNLDQIAITKVAGSSLTPKGFMDAVEKIKLEASGS